ncbi:MAG: SpoIIE family protein phosphatase, partial [Candidatus Woesearchaeota archaeon]|nr:SpoIIE family protein phosphatase [Candidatus Woesearchaeota archaeon]
ITLIDLSFDAETVNLARMAGTTIAPQLYGVLTDESGIESIIEEYIEGKTIAEYMFAGNAPQNTGETIITQLGQLRARGVVHSDIINEQNTMITSQGQVKLLDYGLIIQLMSGSALSVELTRAINREKKTEETEETKEIILAQHTAKILAQVYPTEPLYAYDIAQAQLLDAKAQASKQLAKINSLVPAKKTEIITTILAQLTEEEQQIVRAVLRKPLKQGLIDYWIPAIAYLADFAIELQPEILTNYAIEPDTPGFLLLTSPGGAERLKAIQTKLKQALTIAEAQVKDKSAQGIDQNQIADDIRESLESLSRTSVSTPVQGQAEKLNIQVAQLLEAEKIELSPADRAELKKLIEGIVEQKKTRQDFSGFLRSKGVLSQLLMKNKLDAIMNAAFGCSNCGTDPVQLVTAHPDFKQALNWDTLTKEQQTAIQTFLSNAATKEQITYATEQSGNVIDIIIALDTLSKTPSPVQNNPILQKAAELRDKLINSLSLEAFIDNANNELFIASTFENNPAKAREILTRLSSLLVFFKTHHQEPAWNKAINNLQTQVQVQQRALTPQILTTAQGVVSSTPALEQSKALIADLLGGQRAWIMLTGLFGVINLFVTSVLESLVQKNEPPIGTTPTINLEQVRMIDLETINSEATQLWQFDPAAAVELVTDNVRQGENYELEYAPLTVLENMLGGNAAAEQALIEAELESRTLTQNFKVKLTDTTETVQYSKPQTGPVSGDYSRSITFTDEQGTEKQLLIHADATSHGLAAAAMKTIIHIILNKIVADSKNTANPALQQNAFDLLNNPEKLKNHIDAEITQVKETEYTNKINSLKQLLAQLQTQLPAPSAEEQTTISSKIVLAQKRIERLNQEKSELAGRLSTITIALINPKTHEASIVGGGDAVLHLQKTKTGYNPIAVSAEGMLLGTGMELPAEKITITLAPEDALLITSDGFTEEPTGKQETKLFGIDNVGATLATALSQGKSLAEATQDLVNAVKTHAGIDANDERASMLDDTSLTMVRMAPESAEETSTTQSFVETQVTAQIQPIPASDTPPVSSEAGSPSISQKIDPIKLIKEVVKNPAQQARLIALVNSMSANTVTQKELEEKIREIGLSPEDTQILITALNCKMCDFVSQLLIEALTSSVKDEKEKVLLKKEILENAGAVFLKYYTQISSQIMNFIVALQTYVDSMETLTDKQKEEHDAIQQDVYELLTLTKSAELLAGFNEEFVVKNNDPDVMDRLNRHIKYVVENHKDFKNFKPLLEALDAVQNIPKVYAELSLILLSIKTGVRLNDEDPIKYLTDRIASLELTSGKRMREAYYEVRVELQKVFSPELQDPIAALAPAEMPPKLPVQEKSDPTLAEQKKFIEQGVPFELTRNADGTPRANAAQLRIIEGAPRVGVMGDVQGNFAQMKQAMESAGYITKTGKWKAGKAVFAFAGDLIDRGPESAQVLDFIMNLQEQAEAAGGKVIAVRGNHDQMLLHWIVQYKSQPSIDFSQSGNSWWQQGGKATALSLMRKILKEQGEKIADIDKMLEAHEKNDFEEMNYDSDLAQIFIRDFLALLSSPQGIRYVNFLESLPYAAKINDILVMHGSPDFSAKTLEEIASNPDSQKDMMWERDWIESVIEGDLSEVDAFKNRIGVTKIVFGHTPLGSKVTPSQRSGLIDPENGVFGINFIPNEAQKDDAQGILEFNTAKKKKTALTFGTAKVLGTKMNTDLSKGDAFAEYRKKKLAGFALAPITLEEMVNEIRVTAKNLKSSDPKEQKQAATEYKKQNEKIWKLLTAKSTQLAHLAVQGNIAQGGFGFVQKVLGPDGKLYAFKRVLPRYDLVDKIKKILSLQTNTNLAKLVGPIDTQKDNLAGLEKIAVQLSKELEKASNPEAKEALDLLNELIKGRRYSVNSLKLEAIRLARLQGKSFSAQLSSIIVNEKGELEGILEELLEGETLDQIAKKGIVPKVQGKNLEEKLLEAVTESHEVGALHNDIRNIRNIMLTTKGELKLLDYGYYFSEEKAGGAPNLALENTDLAQTVIAATITKAAVQYNTLMATLTAQLAKQKSSLSSRSLKGLPYDVQLQLNYAVQLIQSKLTPLQNDLLHKTLGLPVAVGLQPDEIISIGLLDDANLETLTELYSSNDLESLKTIRNLIRTEWELITKKVNDGTLEPVPVTQFIANDGDTVAATDVPKTVFDTQVPDTQVPDTQVPDTQVPDTTPPTPQFSSSIPTAISPLHRDAESYRSQLENAIGTGNIFPKQMAEVIVEQAKGIQQGKVPDHRKTLDAAVAARKKVAEAQQDSNPSESAVLSSLKKGIRAEDVQDSTTRADRDIAGIPNKLFAEIKRSV